MRPFTVVVSHCPGALFRKILLSMTGSDLVERLVVVSDEPVRFEMDKGRVLVGAPLPSRETLSRILAGIRTEYLLLLPGSQPISVEPKALERILEVAEFTKAGLVYSDFYEEGEHGKTPHPLNDYQPGSVRDDFDFGAMILFSVPAVRKALQKHDAMPEVKFAGLYDLRLKVSIDHAIHHLPEPLYTVMKADEPSTAERLFAYVDPRNRLVQEEMETIFTRYLKKIGAFLPPGRLGKVAPSPESYPVEASVVIPVRNRVETVAGAVSSALSQETDFSFNVIVVDNHSADGTTAVLHDLARQHALLRLIIPERNDLGIGGCWNEALHDQACGRHAVQLDSDDLYSTGRSLQTMVDALRQAGYAMVIGSYTLVDAALREIPPGLIDHREWTDENGHNNALRINGLGAPRAFDTGLMRGIGFLNVSYGEDYAAALRICREYRIGRIYESLYLCRRWSGNTDARLSLEASNRNDAFKDRVRTEEVAARQHLAKGLMQGALRKKTNRK